jgi:hypothetical protein
MTIKKTGSKYVIRSSSPDIKQVFFGWASSGTRGQNDPEFYGREVGQWRGDYTTWEWKLTKAKVERLIMLIGVGFSEGYYEDAKDERDHRYVLKQLTKKLGVT